MAKEEEPEADAACENSLDILFAPECCRDCTIDLVDIDSKVTFNAAMRSNSDRASCEVCANLTALLAGVAAPPAKAFPQPGSIAWQRLRTCLVKLEKRAGGEVTADDLAAAWFGTAQAAALDGAPAAADEQPSASAVSASQVHLASPRPALPRSASASSLASPAKTVLTDGSPTMLDSGAAAAPGMPGVEFEVNASQSEDEEDPNDCKSINEKAFAFVKGLPMHDMSLKGALPAGTGMMTNIGRMRSTLNDAAMKVSIQRWVQTFRIPALQGLQRRLMARSPSIIGKANVQMEIAYSQMLCRVQCLINLYKLLRQWVDHQSDAKLEDLFLSLDPLREFLTGMGAELAPDLALIAQIATFRITFKKRAKIIDSLKSIDFDQLCKQFHEIQEFNKSALAGAGPPSLEVDEAPPVASAPGKEKPPRKKPQMKKGLNLEQVRAIDKRLTQEPHEQVAKLIVDAISSKLYKTKADALLTATALDAWLEELRGVRNEWVSTVLVRHDSPEKDSFNLFLKALIDLFGCLCESSLKPSVDAARAARKEVYTQAQAKVSNAIVDLAKAIGTYPNGKLALDAALTHSKTGIQDEAANQCFNLAVEQFEKLLEPAFAAQDGWPTHGNNGGSHTMTSIAPYLAEVRTTTTALFTSIGRWSAVALDDLRELIENTLSNFALVLHIANWVMLESLRGVMVGCMPTTVIEAVMGADDKLGAGCDDDDMIDGLDNADPSDAMDDGGATPRASVCMEQVTHTIATAILAHRPETDKYGEMVDKILGEVSKCVEAVEQRAGKEWWTADFVVKEQLSVLADEFVRNRKNYNTLCEYYLSMYELCRSHSAAECVDKDDMTADKARSTSDHLCTFGRIQREHMLSSVVQFELTDGVCPGNTASDVTSIFDTFLVDYGEPTYKLHADDAIHRYMHAVQSASIACSEVHQSVLGEAPRQKMLGMLMRQEDIDEMAKSDIDFQKSIEDIAHDFEQLDHNKSIEKLRDFTEAIGMETVVVPHVQHKDGCSDIAVDEALLVLRLQAGVVNICIPAAHVHSQYLATTDDEEGIGIDVLCGSVATAMATMATELTKYEKLVNCDLALKIEANGMVLPTPIAHFRNWRWLMSLFNGKVQKHILHRMAELLNVAEVLCKSAIPSWSTCFGDDGRLKETMAGKLLTSDKLKQVVDAHNAAHHVMTCMSRGAKLMCITPRLQDNEVTSTAIATARDTLLKANLACVVIMGVEVIFNSRSSADGPAAAKAFLAKHRHGATAQELPAGFWAELEVIAAHVGKPPHGTVAAGLQAPAAPAGAAPGATPPAGAAVAPVVTAAATPRKGAPQSEAGSDMSAPKSSPFKREGGAESTLVFKRTKRG